jgi:hypothetical protein
MPSSARPNCRSADNCIDSGSRSTPDQNREFLVMFHVSMIGAANPGGNGNCGVVKSMKTIRSKFDKTVDLRVVAFVIQLRN